MVDASNTPIKARVGISGDQVVIAGGQVGVDFQYVQNFQIVDTDFSTGAFTIGGLWPGAFTIRAAGQFSPDPIALEATMPVPDDRARRDAQAAADEPGDRQDPEAGRHAGRRGCAHQVQVGRIQDVLLGVVARRDCVHDDSAGHSGGQCGHRCRRHLPVRRRQRRQLHADGVRARRPDGTHGAAARIGARRRAGRRRDHAAGPRRSDREGVRERRADADPRREGAGQAARLSEPQRGAVQRPDRERARHRALLRRRRVHRRAVRRHGDRHAAERVRRGRVGQDRERRGNRHVERLPRDRHRLGARRRAASRRHRPPRMRRW